MGSRLWARFCLAQTTLQRPRLASSLPPPGPHHPTPPWALPALPSRTPDVFLNSQITLCHSLYQMLCGFPKPPAPATPRGPV